MDPEDILKVQPVIYLQDGFLDEAGELKEQINGYCSLAMAFYFREEGITPEHMKVWINMLHSCLENPEKTLKEIYNHKTAKDSAAMMALLKAAQPWLYQMQQCKAFLKHLRRITGQLALIVRMYSKPAA